MVVGTKEGTIHLSIYDSFVIGSFTAPLLPGTDTSELVLHASHKHYSTHSLLLRAPAGKRLYLVPMDLRFISASSEYLSLLASRSTALQNLLRYINQVKTQIVAEWKSTQELPSRFLGSINETLAGQQNRDIVQALYHSVATGHTIPAVREWLVDELSERVRKTYHVRFLLIMTGSQTLGQSCHYWLRKLETSYSREYATRYRALFFDPQSILRDRQVSRREWLLGLYYPADQHHFGQHCLLTPGVVEDSHPSC